MAIREILKFEDPMLRKVCRPVEKFDEKLHTLLDDMAETMYEANGVGLAGPQVGILRRVVIVDVGDGVIELINPVILETTGEQTESEGCLSYPGEYGMVTRPNWVRVQAFDRFGECYEAEGEGLLARAFCHEVDHLDGKIFKDIASEMLED